MAEDRRRSAEIRRMASQKVAAEMVKGATYDSKEEARTAFLDLVDWIDDDVVAAGDRAEAGIRRTSNQATPESPPDAQVVPAGSLPSPNGSEAVSDGSTDPLTDDQAVRLSELLGDIDPALLKLQLDTLNLPFQDDGSLSKDEAIREAVDLMTKGQAKEMVGWMKNVNS